MTYTFRDFHPYDQAIVQQLVLEGLGQRFGEIRPEYNPDLMDIQAHYIDQGATFLVAESIGFGSDIIGCGALIKENGSDAVARIVRVSVREDQQGQGLGRAISQRLIDIAKARGFSKILVETNSDWASALHLYQSCGFVETHRRQAEDFDFIEVHMEMEL